MAEWKSVEEQKRISDEIEKSMKEASEKEQERRAITEEGKKENKVTVKSRGVMSEKLAKKYYGSKSKEAIEGAKRGIEAEKINKAYWSTVESGKKPSIEEYGKRGVTVETLKKFGMVTETNKLASRTQQQAQLQMQQQTPEGYKAVKFTQTEAMRYGLISKETMRATKGDVTLYIPKDTTKGDLIKYAGYLKEQHFNIKEDREKISDKAIPLEKWEAREKGLTQRAEYIGQDPLLKIRYVLEKDFLGLQTLTQYGVTALTGGNWDKTQREMMTAYGREILSDKTPAEFQALKFVGNVGIKVATFQAMSKFPTVAFAGKSLASAFAGYEIGTGLKMVLETGGQATPEQGKQIAEHFARGFIFSVPAQITAYSKGITALRKPEMTYQFSVGKEKGKMYQQPKVTETQSASSSRVDVYEKSGFMQKLGLKAPTKVGELYGRAMTQTKTGDVVGIGESKYVYMGKVHGKELILMGKQGDVSVYEATPEMMHGYSFSKGTGQFKVMGKPTGDIKSVSVGRFQGIKTADTPKGEYWDISQRSGGLQETFQVTQKQTAFSKVKTTTDFNKFFDMGRSTQFIEKPQDTTSFAKIFTAGGSSQAKPPSTLSSAGTSEVKAVVGQFKTPSPKQLTGSAPLDISAVQNFVMGDVGGESLALAREPKPVEKPKTVDSIIIPETAQEPIIESGKFNLKKMSMSAMLSGKKQPIIKGETKLAEKTKQKPVQGNKGIQNVMQESIQKQMQGILQQQWQGQKQAQQLKMKLGQATGLKQAFAQQTSFDFTFAGFGGFVIPSGRKDAGVYAGFKSERTKAIPIASVKMKKMFKKTLTADLLSVTISHARYGKATHPLSTKGAWKKAEKSLFLNVPTVELEKGKKALRSLI